MSANEDFDLGWLAARQALGSEIATLLDQAGVLTDELAEKLTAVWEATAVNGTGGWTPEAEADHMPPSSATVGQMREWIDAHKRRGIEHCPGCNRRIKEDAYNLRQNWVDLLKVMARQPEQWIEFRKVVGHLDVGRNGTLMCHWGLIHRYPGRREDGYKSLGLYEVTDLGRAFLAGEVSVPRRALLRDDKFWGFEDEDDRVFVHDANLGGPFNFAAFMAGEG